MTHWPIWKCLAVILSIALAQIAVAQPSGFGKGRVTAYSDRKIIAEPHNHIIPEGVLRFHIRPQAVAGWPPNGMQARLFRLPATGDGVPAPWHVIGDCFVYYSNLFGIAGASGAVVLTRLEGLSGLTVSPAGITNGRFLIVFERRGNSSPLLRLNGANERNEYFSQGWRVEVVRRPRTQFSAAERNEFLREAARHRAAYNQEVRTIAGRVCYEVQTAADEAESADRYALSDLCIEVPEVASGEPEDIAL